MTPYAKLSTQPCGCDPAANHQCEAFPRCAYGKTTLPSTEVIVTDAVSGGQKGQKLERYDLIPTEAEEELARLYGIGTVKYADRNWEKGYKWGLSVGALRRHLARWLLGESYDQETKRHHLICVAWHAFALYIFELRGLGTDDVRRKA